MTLDTTQITTLTYPFFSIISSGNRIIGCIRDPSFVCEGCVFKKVCKVKGGDLLGKD